MNKFKMLRTFGATLVGLSLLAPAALAAPKGKKTPPATAPAALEAKLTLQPKGLRFGMSKNDVLKLYDRVIEADFKHRWKEVEPGVQMDRLRYEINNAKQAIRLSYQEFDGKPTSLDGSPLRAEYTHNNGEGYLRIKRKDKERYLFFIKDKLWKVIDVYELGEGSKWGADYNQAVEALQKRLGEVEGRRLEPDAEKGRATTEVDFATKDIHLRALDLEKKVGLAYVDLDIESRIASLRKNKGDKKEDVDPSVKSVLR